MSTRGSTITSPLAREDTFGGGLARADTFAGGWAEKYVTRKESETSDEGVLDEETWDWGVLMTRVFCFFLGFVIVVLLCLGGIDVRLMILAGFVFALLVIIIIGTFIDIQWLVPDWCPGKDFLRCFCRTSNKQSNSNSISENTL